MTHATIAAMAPTLIAACIATVLLVGTILLVVHHRLTRRRQIDVARVRWTRPQRAPSSSVEIWRHRAAAAEDLAEQLRREVWLARRTSDELAQQLAAARKIGHSQELHRLAVVTQVIEANQTGHWPVVLRRQAPTEIVPSVTPLNRRHRTVLRSA